MITKDVQDDNFAVNLVLVVGNVLSILYKRNLETLSDRSIISTHFKSLLMMISY